MLLGQAALLPCIFWSLGPKQRESWGSQLCHPWWAARLCRAWWNFSLPASFLYFLYFSMLFHYGDMSTCRLCYPNLPDVGNDKCFIFQQESDPRRVVSHPIFALDSWQILDNFICFLFHQIGANFRLRVAPPPSRLWTYDGLPVHRVGLRHAGARVDGRIFGTGKHVFVIILIGSRWKKFFKYRPGVGGSSIKCVLEGGRRNWSWGGGVCPPILTTMTIPWCTQEKLSLF